MGGIKRKEAPSSGSRSDVKEKAEKSKKQKTAATTTTKPAKPSHLEAAAAQDSDSDSDGGVEVAAPAKNEASSDKASQFKPPGTSSAEAHAKQRQLAKERKAAKPHADDIARSKQLWERLRRKSHVPKEDREELLTELFGIIDGRVRDFVFKHDSVRVVQCAVKYARPQQLKSIVKELQHDVRDLVESRYGKFLVAKMVVQGDREDKDLMIPQFYGQIKKLINHPEASWILDDIYRQIATPAQKAMMLREWYGTEFALFGKQRPNGSTPDGTALTGDLKTILAETPEKRKPILSYLKTMINNLIQKKMTGFTMLHDAMLQYFLALDSGSEEHSDFMEILKGDIDAEEEGGGGDLFRNLAFTQSGARLVCLTLAYGSAKDRKVILKCFKDNIELMAFDSYAKMVLVTGLDVTDDTKMTSQSILRELLGLTIEDKTQRFDRLEALITNINSRLAVLFPIAGPQKWLIKDGEKDLIEEVRTIRATTSKKAPEVRRQELLSHMSAPLLEFVAERAANLVQSSFACQAVTEILLECHDKDDVHRQAAKEAVAALAAGDPHDEGHIARDPAASRMLKTLVSGGTFDPSTKKVKLAEPRLCFADVLYPVIESHLVDWACSDSSFVVVALLESEDVPKGTKKDVEKALGKGKKEVKKAANGDGKKNKTATVDEEGSAKKKRKVKKEEVKKGNAGAKILLDRM